MNICRKEITFIAFLMKTTITKVLLPWLISPGNFRLRIRKKKKKFHEIIFWQILQNQPLKNFEKHPNHFHLLMRKQETTKKHKPDPSVVIDSVNGSGRCGIPMLGLINVSSYWALCDCCTSWAPSSGRSLSPLSQSKHSCVAPCSSWTGFRQGPLQRRPAGAEDRCRWCPRPGCTSTCLPAPSSAHSMSGTWKCCNLHYAEWWLYGRSGGEREPAV